MDRTSHKLLAAACFSSNQNRAIGWSDPRNELGDPLHGFRFADDLGRASGFASLEPLQFRRPLFEFPALSHPL